MYISFQIHKLLDDLLFKLNYLIKSQSYVIRNIQISPDTFKTGFPGRFNVRYCNGIIIKKNKMNSLGKVLKTCLQHQKTFLEYKYIIENTVNNPIFGHYTIKGFSVEPDGSYCCEYVEGVRLDRIKDNLVNIHLYCLVAKLKDLHQLLKENGHLMSGDWALHNLIFCHKSQNIYNIDIEGFFSEKQVSTAKLVNTFSSLIQDLERIKRRTLTAIIWNPALKNLDHIKKHFNKKSFEQSIYIKTEELPDLIQSIYKDDIRCAKEIVLPPKISTLQRYDGHHVLIQFQTQNQNKEGEISQEGTKLKNTIRNAFKSKVNNYVRDIIIHVCDDWKQSQKVFELLS